VFDMLTLPMSLKHWILDEKGRPVSVDLFTWAKWFGTRERFICQETIAQNRISTIFLGIDHSFAHGGPPILWETMTFGAKLDNETRRCAGTKEQAEAMHEEMVKDVCEASGIPYDPARERVTDPGVLRRQWAVQRRRLKQLHEGMAKLTKPKRRRKLKP
jgi:hypothetical protein